MQIIFGTTAAKQASERCIVLELDTFNYANDKKPITCYCAISAGDITLGNMAKLEEMTTLHEAMMTNFKNKNWNVCSDSIEHLMPFWGESMRTFYLSITERLTEYKENEPTNWTAIVDKC